MNNYSIDLLKILYLNQYDLDRDKTTVFVEGNNITVHLYFNPTDRICPYCKSKHTNIHARITKNIFHPVLAGK